MLLWKKALEKHLRELLGEKLKLVWTQNRRTMISFYERKGVPVLRLHESFGTADEPLKKDLFHYLTHPHSKVPKGITKFVEQITEERKNQKLETPKQNHRGENFNLAKIQRKLNRLYFNGKLKGSIGWGRKAFGKNKSSIVFGSYYPNENIIRIHPVLDTELVPLFYLESVVHHEMVHRYLHTIENEPSNEGLHPPRFKKLEAKFKHHQLALAWEKSQLAKLMNYQPPKTAKKKG